MGMNRRRDTLRFFGAAVLGITLPVTATPSASIRVIGVGDAGIHVLLAARSYGLHHADDNQPAFACVTMGRQSILGISEAQRLHPGFAPIRTVQLGLFGSGGNVGIAQTSAFKHQDDLRSLVAGADIVILVAGLGGGTGSGVSPILAAMAQEAGAQTMAVVVTPFDWELGRYPNAFDALKVLRSHCDYMVALSNQAAGDAMGDGTTLEDVIKHQEQDGAESIRMLMRLGTRVSGELRIS